MRRKKAVCLLGATGSIGGSCLDVMRRNASGFTLEAASCNQDLLALVKICEEFLPRAVCVGEGKGSQMAELSNKLKKKPKIYEGASGLNHLTAEYGELVVAGLSGSAGLAPVFEAVSRGKTIALANKESIVMAGQLVMDAAKASGAKIIPLDSEHNAVYQCLGKQKINGVRKIVLTASGGPFLNMPASDFTTVTVEQALAHPKWSMGRKISIDSASMMNKALEVIEASWLFGIPGEKIEVLVHPESVVHSMAEMNDGSVIAQMGVPDMRVPMAHCLGLGERINSGADFLDLARLAKLTFKKPDFDKFKSLGFAYEVLKINGTAPAALNGANEALVELFLGGRISFADIFNGLQSLMEQLRTENSGSVPQNLLGSFITVEDAIAANEKGRSFILGAFKGKSLTNR